MRKIIKVAGFVFMAVLLSFTLFSCGNGKNDEILLDDSDPLALLPDIRWGVIKDPYAAFRTDTYWDAAVSGHARRGDIFAVEGSATVRTDKGTEIWYKFKDGWISDSIVDIYQNKFKAAKAAALLSK